MRYQSLSSFQKHLASAAPHNLCRLYLVAIADDFERNRAIDLILSYLPASPERFSGSDCTLRTLFDAMQSQTLLGEKAVVVLDEAEKLSKKDLQALSDYLNVKPLYIAMVIFGTRSKTALSSLIEKEGVILDLLEEKPWDKEKRIAEQLASLAKSAGKKISTDVSQLLFERVGVDSALLLSEMDKLICYVGDREIITRKDILAISPASRTLTLWQTAEEVIWEKGHFPPLDDAAFHGLIPALRSQLHLGLTIASLIEENYPADQWNRYLPKIWPKTLEKRSSQAASLGVSYFQKGLHKLFEVELLSRTHSTQYGALLDLFKVQLHG